MSEAKQRTLEVVRIEWIDSEALNEWTECASLRTAFGLITTVGLLVHFDADAYLIASSYDPENDSINAAMWVPRACVRRLTTIAVLDI